MAVCREAILCTLHTEVVGVAECPVGVLSSASVRLLVGFRTFHTLVLLTVRHAWALELTAAVKDRRITAVGTLHANIVFAGQASAVGRVLRIPLGRTLTTLVIHTVFEVTVDVLTLVERGESLVRTLVAIVVRTVRLIRRLAATRVGFESSSVAVLTLTALVHRTIGTCWRLGVASVVVDTHRRRIVATLVLAHVVDTDLSRCTVVVFGTIPGGTLVVLANFSATLRRRCCVVLRTPTRWAALACDALVTVGAGLGDIPVRAIIGTLFCFVSVASKCSWFA